MFARLRTLCCVIVALSCAVSSAARESDPSLGFVGLHGGAFEKLSALAGEAGVRCGYIDDESIRTGDDRFTEFDAIVIQHVRDAKELAARLGVAKAAKPGLRVFALSDSSALAARCAPGLVESDAALSAFYRAPRVENLEAMLSRLRAICRGEPLPAQEPLPLDLGVLRRPGREAPFPNVAELIADAKARGIDVASTPRVAVVAHATHFLLQQPRVIDALVAELDARGAFAFIAIDGESKGDGSDYESLMLEAAPDAVIHTCHSTDDADFRNLLDAPHLHSMFFRGQSIAEWTTSPIGLAPSEIMFHVATQEMLGATDPIATCGTLRPGGGAEDFTPIDDRIARVVGRALARARLRKTANSEKRVAIVYYDREASRSSLMRGSPTGMMLNAPQSILAVLSAMRGAGYRVEVPEGEDELVALAERNGRVVGVSGPGETEALADSGLVPLVPVAEYESWLERRVPKEAREALEAHWGKPPGTICVVERGGAKFLVVPRIDLGNVVLMPQPLRGEAYDPSQTHDKAIPPPHNYLAAYFWLESSFGADALVHFGTHGSEFFLPGKNVGMSGNDWPDILLGDLPNFSPWVINNLGESILSKRRAYATLIDHLVPPTTEAELDGGLDSLHRDIERFARVEPGTLREKMRATISDQVRALGLAADLALETPDGSLLSDDHIDDVCEYLHAIQEELTPTTLHHLGEAPPDDLRIPWLVHCGGQRFLDALAATPGLGSFSDDHGRVRARAIAEELLRRVLRDGLALGEALVACGAIAGSAPSRELSDAITEITGIDGGLAATGDEIANLLRGLDGRFVPPGPGQAPERNPSSVPTGRNMYLLDPRELPTREAWEIGKQLADDLIARHREETGDYPTKIAFNIRATNSFRDFGVMEAQVLCMLGCEPVRDARGQVIDVALVPREKLGRPRIDVFLQGGSRYNDMLADRAKLLDRAVRLAIAETEADNRVRAATIAREEELVAAGVPRERATTLAKARMFGAPPGGGNASYSYLFQRSADWTDKQQLADAYFAAERYAYTEDAWGEEADLAFRSALKDSEYVLRSWADTTRGPTTDKYTWMHGGSLALAVEYASGGKRPRFVLNDLRDMDRASLIDAEDALRRDFRVRALNRKWIEGMMKEGYAGADQLKVITSNAFGWQVTRPGAIPDSTFEQLADVYVRDSMKLGLKEFFARENPWALQGITEDLLEAARKGLWNASEATLADLATALVESRARHGDAGGFLSAGNVELERFVAARSRGAVTASATAPPDVAATPATPTPVATAPTPPAEVAESSNQGIVPNPPKADVVTGVEMAPIAASPRSTNEPTMPKERSLAVIVVPLAAAAILALGYLLRFGAPR